MNALVDYSGFVRPDGQGHNSLNLAVEGIHCAGCASKIEKALNAMDHVQARVNLTRRRLSLVWDGDRQLGNQIVGEAEKLGFKFSPVTEDRGAADAAAEKFLLRCMAVAGFSAGNIMIFSLALWFSNRGSMGGGTQDLFHWASALVAIPAIIYSGRPFFASAWRALKGRTTNMDVPISVAVILSTAMSLYETARQGEYVYFDSAIMLLFLLLTGRFLDQRARGRARAAAQDVLALSSGIATIIDGGHPRRIPAQELEPGMLQLAASGERIFADGVLSSTGTEVDASAISGETLPRRLEAGSEVLAGMINLGNPVMVRIDKTPAGSLIADIAKLMERAEQGNAAYVRIADRIAGWYTPAVHLLALATFLGWHYGFGAAWQPSLMNAVAVLIITCPCALGLAVPVVQVLAGHWLFRRGMLIKSGDALERLEKIDTVIFDKTGTLTTGELELASSGDATPEELRIAGALAAHSRHPVSRAVARACGGTLMDISDVRETPGGGLAGRSGGTDVRLGSRAFCGVTGEGASDMREAWLKVGAATPRRLLFRDGLRPDAAQTMRSLRKMGLKVMVLTGDTQAIAAITAAQVNIDDVRADVNPRQKLDVIEALLAEGRKVLMVGDGINDAPSLVRASASMSPSSATHIAQNAADIVFQGERLMPVCDALRAARFSQRLVRQNFLLAFAYNVLAIPLAMAGLVTPLIAAISMSASSLAVTANALRMNGREE